MTVLLVCLGVLVEAEGVVLRDVKDDGERLLEAVEVLDGVVKGELLGDGVVDDGEGVDDDVGEADVVGVGDEANDEGCEEDDDLECYSERSANSYDCNVENSRHCRR